MRVTRFGSLLISLIVLSATVSAQDKFPWDSSGNGLLAGTYNFRQVAWFLADDLGNVGDAVTIYGNITFDGLRDASGNGHYSLIGSFVEAQGSPIPVQFATNGTYRIASSGLGFITNPIFTSGGAVWGTSAQGLFIGSSTEDGLNDMFVAAKVPSVVPTAASLTGSYAIAEMNFPSLNVFQVRDTMLQINPDGAGNLGNLNASGYIGNLNTNITQAIPNAHYSFNVNGLGTIAYGGTLTNANLVAGSRLFYISPDKRFIFGGSIAGFDIFVGVLAPPTNTAPPNLLDGLYYQAGVDEDLTTSSASDLTLACPITPHLANLSSYFGAFQATAGTIVGHQRLLTSYDGILSCFTAFDYTYSDTFSVNQDGTMDDFFGQHHVVGAGGDIRIGIGTGIVPGINVALRAPALSGPSVFLNPEGVTNWFSSAPFTVGLSPGAFMALSGTGLSGVNMTDPTMPTTLGNVQVLVNDRPAPIYQVSPTSIIIVAPYATSGSYATIQVLNNGVGSGTVTVFITATTPGVLADQGGAGHVIAQHLDYSLVTAANPAMPGEIILFYVEGLGAVSPPVADGVPAPLSPLSPAVVSLATPPAQPSLSALVFNKQTQTAEQATILFAGLTPTLIADYALIIVIPADIPQGDAFLDVSGPDSYTTIATVPVGGASSAAVSGGTTTAAITPAVRVRGTRLVRNARPLPADMTPTIGAGAVSVLGSPLPAHPVDNSNPAVR